MSSGSQPLAALCSSSASSSLVGTLSAAAAAGCASHTAGCRGEEIEHRMFRLGDSGLRAHVATAATLSSHAHTGFKMPHYKQCQQLLNMARPPASTCESAAQLMTATSRLPPAVSASKQASSPSPVARLTCQGRWRRTAAAQRCWNSSRLQHAALHASKSF